MGWEVVVENGAGPSGGRKLTFALRMSDGLLPYKRNPNMVTQHALSLSAAHPTAVSLCCGAEVGDP